MEGSTTKRTPLPPRGRREATTAMMKQQQDERRGSVVVRVCVDVISDTMCPWCWVGKRNLELALRGAATAEGIEADVNWLPYFLDRDLDDGDEGTPTEDYYLKNYGDSQAGERMKLRLVPEGSKVGIDFSKYCEVSRFRPTIRSHLLIDYAKRNGKQDEVVEALFRMFCQEGKALNDVENLVEVAERAAGLDGNEARAYIESESNRRRIYELAESVEDLADGVPTFIFYLRDHHEGGGPRYTLGGSQSPEAFRAVLEKLAVHQKRLDRLDKKRDG